MANYAYLLALSGFRYSAPQKTLYLDPKINREEFRCFFSVEGAWGVVHFRDAAPEPQIEVEVWEGELSVERVIVGDEETDAWVMKRRA
jgi:hypothetical protein